MISNRAIREAVEQERNKVRFDQSQHLGRVVLRTNRVFANVAAGTVGHIDGLQFDVLPGYSYHFEFFIAFTVDDPGVGLTGTIWTLDGPANPVAFTSCARYTNSDSTWLYDNIREGYHLYATVGTTVAGYAPVRNFAVIEGLIVPSVAGTLYAEFAPDQNSRTITVLANLSDVTWWGTAL